MTNTTGILWTKAIIKLDVCHGHITTIGAHGIRGRSQTTRFWILGSASLPPPVRVRQIALYPSQIFKRRYQIFETPYGQFLLAFRAHLRERVDLSFFSEIGS